MFPWMLLAVLCALPNNWLLSGLWLGFDFSACLFLPSWPFCHGDWEERPAPLGLCLLCNFRWELSPCLCLLSS
ncbi:hypothetical protein PRUPE_2G115000 [Prunus persica]|uniref:Uncharacterized protein n=1 Tax=Prunus persica TaxID=3760 RepID=A0A251QEK9_PRUPE|nr:hypothetical protein PRUPE_2G115000 [Prunus persica]